MKKTVKKLSLNRLTLHHLEARDLLLAQGADYAGSATCAAGAGTDGWPCCRTVAESTILKNTKACL